MKAKFATGLCLVLLALALPKGKAQDAGLGQPESISLTVPAGVPLRLYLTKRVSKQLNAPVQAKLLTSLYAFDHEVIPAGTVVLGRVSRVQPVPKWERIRAVLGGDFTPLLIAQIEFTSAVFSDGSKRELHTFTTAGLQSLVPRVPPKQRSQSGQATSPTGVIGTEKQKAKDQIDSQIARVRSIPDLVRGTDKKEWLYDYAMSRLPYHPQSVRNRTRFDAELEDPLDFGEETVTQDSMALLGSQPAAGSIAHARLLTPLDSLTSTQGEKVEAILEQPLFSVDHRLVLPQGTLVQGSVAMVKRAGWFHRPGRLRFSFQSVDLTSQAAALRLAPQSASTQQQPSPREPELKFRTQATLNAAESGNAPLKVDKEGGVQTSESKTRFIGTAVALLIARAAGDNDPERIRGGAITGQKSNIGGRTLGGGLGLGLLGSIAAQSSRNVGAALGYYGLAWTVYSTVVKRGAEVQFDKNAVIDIGFNQRDSAIAPDLPNNQPTGRK